MLAKKSVLDSRDQPLERRKLSIQGSDEHLGEGVSGYSGYSKASGAGKVCGLALANAAGVLV